MNTKLDRIKLHTDMVVCQATIKNLLSRISKLEADTNMLTDEKLSEIKKIKEEITKVGAEIDTIKKEITLLDTRNIN